MREAPELAVNEGHDRRPRVVSPGASVDDIVPGRLGGHPDDDPHHERGPSKDEQPHKQRRGTVGG